MKAIRIAALGAALLVGGAAIAQPPASQPPVAARAHQKGHHGFGQRGLFQGITLTDAQKTQLKAIHRKYAEQRHALHGERGAHAQGRDAQRVRPDSATRAKARSLMEAQAAEIRAILTADQQKTFDANLAKLREHAKKAK